MRSFPLLLTLCLIAACQTQDPPTPAPATRKIGVKNKLGIPINYSIHGSRDDYNANTNALITFRLEDDASDSIDISVMTGHDSLFVDMYSDSRDYSNLLTDYVAYSTASLTSGKARIAFASPWDEESFGIHFLGANRQSLLWTAVNYRDHPNYTWSELPEYKKYYSIKLNKDGTFIMQKKDSLNNEITIKGYFGLQPSKKLYLVSDDYQPFTVEPRNPGTGTLPEIWIREGSNPKGYICAPNL